MFPWCKPKPTKAELVRQSVAGGVQALLEHVPVETLESAKVKAKGVALQAGEIVSDKLHQATDVVSHTLHDVADRVREASVHAAEVAPDHLEAARERASALRSSAVSTGSLLAERASEKAHLAADSAATFAASARDTVSERIQSVRGRAAVEADEFRDEAEATRDRLAKAAEDARDDWSENAAETRDNLVKAALGAVAFWKGRAAEAVEDVQIPEPVLAKVSAEPVEIEVQERNSKLLWVLVGLAVGVILVLLFAPGTGRRSRAMVKDRLKKLKTGAADAAATASDKAHDLRNRADGMASKLESKISGDSSAADDDVTIADRVKSELGHLDFIQDIERLNINVEFGTVFLRGPALDEETQAAIEKAVSKVPGVKEVKSEFLTIEESIDPSLAQ